MRGGHQGGEEDDGRSVVLKAGGNSLAQCHFSARGALLDAHVFYKTSQAHSQPQSTNPYEISPSCKDLVVPMLSWLLNIALYSCEFALASGILRGF